MGTFHLVFSFGVLISLLAVISAQTPSCTGFDCGLHGKCIGNNVCLCDLGWRGAACDEAICNPDCGSNGRCTGPNQCTCDSQYTGIYCRTPVCSSRCKEPSGFCESPGKCKCLAGWSPSPDGSTCDTAVCTAPVGVGTAPCNGPNFGTCIGPETCRCNGRATGAKCDKPFCWPTCQNGECQFVPSNSPLVTRCVCKSDTSGNTLFGGNACNEPVCGAGCGEHGKCSAPGDCTCEIGWTNSRPLQNGKKTDCAKPLCTRCDDSAGKGTCLAPDTCQCNAAYSGSDCEQDVKRIPSQTGLVLFMLDKSASVGSTNFDKIKNYISDMASQLVIGPSNTKTALVTFDQVADWHKNKLIDTLAEFRGIISGAIGGQVSTSNAEDAFKKAQEAIKSPPALNTIVVMVTDGLWEKPLAAKRAADKLKAEGVTIVLAHIDATGTSDLAQRRFLQSVASSREKYISLRDAVALSQKKHEILPVVANITSCSGTCQNGGICNSGTCVCKQLFAGANCEQLICGNPPIVASSFKVDEDSKSPAAHIRFVCYDGFEIEGSPTVNCTVRGWSSKPVCRRRCGDPPAVLNAHWRTEVLDRSRNIIYATYICSQGHVVDGSNPPTDRIKVVCENGVWKSKPTCTKQQSRCGNSILEIGEECDDGNSNSGDGCNFRCQKESFVTCGNGFVERHLGESCDDGNRLSGDGCDFNCRKETRCGNGILEPDEQCDDGNLINDDGCSAACRRDLAPAPSSRCGNGLVEDGEQCDDGNLFPGDGCNSRCAKEESIRKLCNSPRLDVPNGSVQYHTASASYGRVTVRCNNGYLIDRLRVPATSAHCVLGVWDSQPKCSPEGGSVASSEGIDDKCLACIKQAENLNRGCRIVGDFWQCGEYALDFEYVRKCSPQPLTGDVQRHEIAQAQWNKIVYDVNSCVRDETCAKNCVRSFVNEYTRFCVQGRPATCTDYAMVHKTRRVDGCALNSFSDFARSVDFCYKSNQ